MNIDRGLHLGETARPVDGRIPRDIVTSHCCCCCYRSHLEERNITNSMRACITQGARAEFPGDWSHSFLLLNGHKRNIYHTWKTIFFFISVQSVVCLAKNIHWNTMYRQSLRTIPPRPVQSPWTTPPAENITPPIIYFKHRLTLLLLMSYKLSCNESTI